MPPQTQQPDVQTTIKDPEFLKLSSDDQVAVLQHLTSKGAPGLIPPPESGIKKTARGAALGTFEGLGVSEGQTAGEVLKGTAKNVGAGVSATVKEGVSSLTGQAGGYKPPDFSKPTDPFLSVRSGSALDLMATGIERAGTDAWKGIKTKDPELFAHGLASAITQIFTLGIGSKSKVAGAAKDTTAAKLGAAMNITGEHVKNLKTAIPDIVDEAKRRGVSTVGELQDAVKTASKTIDNDFNTALAPIANTQYIPVEIERAIRNLETPNMAKTAAGQAELAEINRAAAEFQQPWTYQELNSERMTRNNNLNSFYGKDTRGQAASRIQTEIDKAVRDKASDIVYGAVDRANPGFAAKNMKVRQGALWALSDFLTDRTSDLEAKQLRHEGTGPLERIGAHGYVSGAGRPHAYLSGLSEMFSEGAGEAANRKVKSTLFPSTGQRAGRAGAAALKGMGRVGIASLPIDALVGSEVNKRRGGLKPPPALDED